MIRLLLVDDHIVVRQGLTMLLSAREDIEIVGEASDGLEAVQLAQSLQPDVILMDLTLPQLDGVEATRQITALGLPCAVLVLTSSVQAQRIREAIQAGARGYVLKVTQAHQLLEAIERAARGQRTLDPLAADALMDSLAQPNELDELTAREREVLRAVALGRANAQIGNDLGISEATVRAHLASILSKLALRDRAHATIFAVKHGLVSLDELD